MISKSFPIWSIAKKYNLPYEVALQLADSILGGVTGEKPDRCPTWHVQAHAYLTAYVGNAVWKDVEDLPSITELRAELFAQIINEIKEQIVLHRTPKAES